MSPSAAIADQKAEHAVPDQRLQRREIFVSMERGFAGLVGFFMGAKSSWGQRSEKEGRGGSGLTVQLKRSKSLAEIGNKTKLAP